MIQFILILIVVIIILIAINVIKYNIFNVKKYYTDPVLVYGIIATIGGIIINYLITYVIIKDWCTNNSLLKRIIIETLIILIVKNIILSFINLNNLFTTKWLIHIAIIVIIQIFYMNIIYPVISNYIKLEHKHKEGHIHNIACMSMHNIIIYSIVTYIILFFE